MNENIRDRYLAAATIETFLWGVEANRDLHYFARFNLRGCQFYAGGWHFSRPWHFGHRSSTRGRMLMGCVISVRRIRECWLRRRSRANGLLRVTASCASAGVTVLCATTRAC